MIELRLHGDTVQLKGDFADADKCKQVGGGKWKKPVWEYSVEALPRIAEVFKGEKVRADQSVFDMLESLRYRNAILKNIKAKDFKLDEHPFLMYHQKQCRAIAKYYPRFAFFLDTGTGKTLTALQIIEDKGDKFVVLCPKAIIKAAWLDDQQHWFPNMRLLPMGRNMKKYELEELHSKWQLPAFRFKATKDDYTKALMAAAQVYVVNPESFKPDIKTYSELPVNGIIIDESTTIKNPQSQITKAVTDFADKMDYAYILSGAPAPNGQQDYFSQMRVVDTTLLGSSFYSFRLKYFRPVGYMGYDWELIEGADKEIGERVAEKSIVIRKEDCLDLPPKTYLKRYIELPPDAMKIYKQMEKASCPA
jgi:SNF2 family DNA or RNA helicase